MVKYMLKSTFTEIKMKVLIIYATRGGLSKRCAELLRDSLPEVIETSLFDARRDTLPSPSEYDVAVVGGSIRMGALDKKLKKYIKKYTSELSAMHTAAFICCGYTHLFEEYRDIEFPKALKCSLGIHCFGGELKPEKLKGVDKILVKMIRSSVKYEDFEESFSSKDSLPEMLPETVTRLADRIRDLL
jgi:menaquinone-dependent protoporphyrinogen oxidase